MYVILFITHHGYHSLTHLKTTAIEIQDIKIIKKEWNQEKRTFSIIKQITHSWEGGRADCYTEKFIVNRFASVDNEFLGVTICSTTLSTMCYLYIGMWSFLLLSSNLFLCICIYYKLVHDLVNLVFYLFLLTCGLFHFILLIFSLLCWYSELSTGGKTGSSYSLPLKYKIEYHNNQRTATMFDPETLGII
jgi:hypothetical protein